jgi:hypothetical protein
VSLCAGLEIQKCKSIANNNFKSKIMKTTIIIAITLLFLSACDISVSTNSGNKTADNLNTVSESAQKIRNGITYDSSGGLIIETAFLMKDDGELITDDNTMKANERFKLILKLSGWQAENGKVQIGAGERLRNSNQVVMLQEDDLFANAGAVSAEDAEVITLVMEVLNTETIYDFYETEFMVWNKEVDQMVRGSYRFKLKK